MNIWGKLHDWNGGSIFRLHTLSAMSEKTFSTSLRKPWMNAHRVRKVMIFGSLAISALFIPAFDVAANLPSAHEILTIKTGNGPDNIGNQFAGAPTEPYNGFGVDSQGNIFISDIVHSSILKFSSKGKSAKIFYWNRRSSFLPGLLCIDNNNILYVHNEKEQEIVAISPNGNVIKRFNPQSAFEYKSKEVPILSLACRGSNISISFGIQEQNTIKPVYQDSYNNNFDLISRQTYESQEAYFESIRRAGRPIETIFEDARGYKYGYPVVKDWYGKYLPLIVYSNDGKLLITLDGSSLTKITRYDILDYFSGREKIGLNLKYIKGNSFMIVNGHVTRSGAIYVLVANNDRLKVFRVDDDWRR